MSIHETNPESGLKAGLDPASGLPGHTFELNRDLFGQPLSKAPSAIGNYLDQPFTFHDGTIDPGLRQDTVDPDPSRANATHSNSIYGDEFESGIPAIDYAAQLVGKAVGQVDKAIEASTPIVGRAIHQTIDELSDTIHDSIETARSSWNAPDNQFHTALNGRVSRAIGSMKHWFADLSSNPEISDIKDSAIDLGRNLAEKTRNAIQAAQAATEVWINTLFDEAYSDTPNGFSIRTANIANSLNADATRKPFVGIIDTGYGKYDHGRQVANAIERISEQPPAWLGDGVGVGGWAESLVQFVDAAQASGQDRAIANLSFDLTQINPDGSITTRSQLTPAEQAALAYAHDHGVLIVVSSGNHGGAMSALGQASQAFDNIIAVGAADGTQRADYSSYGNGLDLVAQGRLNGSSLTGTSLAAAQVTGTIAKLWADHPELSMSQVIHTLESTAKDLHTPGVDAETGFGLLNRSAAIDQAKTIGETSQTQHREPPLDLEKRLINEDILQHNFNGATPSERSNALIPDEDGSSGSSTAAEYRMAQKAQSKPSVITVTSGDTLWAIAEENLGDGDRWTELRQADGSTFTEQEASQLHVGMAVYLPKDELNQGTVDRLDSDRPSGTTPTQINQKGLEMVKEFEGLRLNAYQDPGGVWTIGYGHTSDVSPGEVISEAQAEALLKQDLAEAESAVRKSVKVPLTSNQFSALVSFTYNLGAGNLARSDLLDRLNQGDYEGAANEFSRWVYAKGEKLLGLVRRREYERTLFLMPDSEITSSGSRYGSANAAEAWIESAPSQGTEYTIQSGDTLSAIAQQQLGDSRRWREITKADGSPFTEQEARLVQVGAVVHLPSDRPDSPPSPAPIPPANQGTVNSSVPSERSPQPISPYDQTAVLTQIRLVENTVPGAYDPYIAAQTLRRKTNEKYSGTMFNYSAAWWDNLPSFVPFNKYPGGDASSTYAKLEELPLFSGEMQLENGMTLPTGHFLAALSFQFGTAPNVRPWDNTYAGDLGSVAGAMEDPDSWVTSDTPEAEIAKTRIKASNDLKEKLAIALRAKAPFEQLDADIVAHVVGDWVESKDIRISQAISDVSKLSKGEIYDAFMMSEFGYHLADLVNDPFVDGPYHNSQVSLHLQGRMADFISKYLILQNIVGDSSTSEGESDASQESIRLVAKDFVQHLLDQGGVLSRNEIATLDAYSYLRV